MMGDTDALKASSLLTKSVQGASFMIVLQVGSRALTFLVNQLLLRFLSPELLGIATQLEVYSISVLFFARESLRVAIQRQTDVGVTADGGGKTTNFSPNRQSGAVAAEKTQAVVNLAYISLFLGIVFDVGLAWIYRRSLASSQAILDTPYFDQALQLYGFGAFWELLAEPCFVVAQQKSHFKIRAAAESIATVLRCLVTCGSVIIAAKQGVDIGVLSFALGQCAYGLCLLSVYCWCVSKIAVACNFSLFASRIASSHGEYALSYFSKPLLAIGTSLFLQGVVKHVLTQGDVILISYLAPLKAQGAYALASNYGGLIARVVFQPLEESCRNYFGKVLSSIDSSPSKVAVQSASDSLRNILRFYVLLSISAAALGPTIAPLLLRMVAGSRWTSSGAGDILADYCYYIPLLALNGVTEAFISAVASKSELNHQSAWMLAFSAGFAGAGFIFLRILKMGAKGLVWANVINMALRIIWSWSFIRAYMNKNDSLLTLSSIMPKGTTIAVGVAAGAVLARMEDTFTGDISDFLKSGAIAAVFLVLFITSERHYLKNCYRQLQTPKE